MRIKVLSIVLFVDHRNFNSIVHKLYVLMPIFFWSVGSTSGSSSWWGQHCLLHHTISCGPHLTSKLRRPNTIIVTHIHSRIPARERRAKGQGWHQMPKGGDCGFRIISRYSRNESYGRLFMFVSSRNSNFVNTRSQFVETKIVLFRFASVCLMS